MSAKSARAQRQRQEHDAERERYRQVLLTNPLPLADKLRLLQDAEYMTDRLLGIASRPPSHWPPEQVAEFAALLASPEGRSGLWAMFERGRERLDAKAAVMEAGGAAETPP